MMVSCLPVSFFDQITSGRMEIRDWARIARGAGLDAIDLSSLFIKSHFPVHLDRIKKDLDAEGMPVTMLTTYPDFVHSDAIERRRQLEYLRRDIALASFLGAKYVRITAGQAHPETSIPNGIDWVVESFGKAQVVARDLGVTLVYENHAKPGAWACPDFSHPTPIFLAIVERTADIHLGVNFDTANTIAYGDEALPVLLKVLDRVTTVHAADTKTRGVLTHTLLGTGLVPFMDIFAVLKKVGYGGWICIEEGSGLGEDGVRKAQEFVRASWAKS